MAAFSAVIFDYGVSGLTRAKRILG
jgi:hypothetical protein